MAHQTNIADESGLAYAERTLLSFVWAMSKQCPLGWTVRDLCGPGRVNTRAELWSAVYVSTTWNISHALLCDRPQYGVAPLFLRGSTCHCTKNDERHLCRVVFQLNLAPVTAPSMQGCLPMPQVSSPKVQSLPPPSR